MGISDIDIIKKKYRIGACGNGKPKGKLSGGSERTEEADDHALFCVLAADAKLSCFVTMQSI